MSKLVDPASLLCRSVYMVGIKGSGMAALADLLVRLGVQVSGSDTTEEFFTDAALGRLQIMVYEGFSADNLPSEAELVVYSAAYDPATHPELIAARARGLPLLSYTEALGMFSAGRPAAAIAGVHGKTSTAAIAATLLRELGLPGAALVGSVVPSLGGSAVHVGGDRFFIAETCEYKRNFLAYHPEVVVITNVEPDHLDYFRDYSDIRAAFIELTLRLPHGGTVVYCADDSGAAEVAVRAAAERPDLRVLAYGESARGAFAVREIAQAAGVLRFCIGELAGEAEGGELASVPAQAPATEPVFSRGAAPSADTPTGCFELRVPGRHNALNTAAALAAVQVLAEELGFEAAAAVRAGAPAALAGFRGTARRSELVGEAGGVSVLDDYAHHPTAIRATLAGLRAFYPGRRLIVDFMSHTYTRTAALLDEFAAAFGDADAVILHKIYASAREQFDGRVTGKDLYDRVASNHPGAVVHYTHEVLDALQFCLSILKPGDVFVTMGAGDNWRLGRTLLEELRRSGSTV